MSEEIKNLKPELVWKHFHAFTQHPRPTHHCEAISKYIAGVGEELGLETRRTEAGNVFIYKPASEGYEDHPMVTLQSHMDMVPQKTPESDHDFEKDPIDTYIDGEWVTARDTTLGADDGIGDAITLAILEDNTLKHGPIEAIFTVDEEEGMIGAHELVAGDIKGKYLINLDSEMMGEIFIGCAGGVDVTATLGYKEEKAKKSAVAYELSLSGLKGGHSGVDINLGRGNAVKMLFRFLKHAVRETNLDIASVDAGTLRNAIPREAKAIVCVKEGEKADTLANMVEEWESLFNAEYGQVENHITFTATPLEEEPKMVMPREVRDAVILAISAVHNGVASTLVDFPGTTEASSNLAILSIEEGEVRAKFLVRSSSESRKQMVADMVCSAFELIGAEVELSGSYTGWQPNAQSHLLDVTKESYKELFKSEPKLQIIHGGLETGLFQGIAPETDMVSVGPTILHPHSPDERVKIDTVGQAYDLVVRMLEKL